MQKIRDDSLNPNEAKLKLASRDLILGMYVSEIDCPWADTPFPMGGFYVRNAEDIQVLLKHCKEVWIDINKGAAPKKKKNNLTILSSARKSAPESTPLKIKRDVYTETHSIKQLLDKAHESYQQFKRVFHDESIGLREGRAFSFKELEKPLSTLMQSMLANPHAVIWILNTDSEETLPTDYSVRAAVWATLLARQIGMGKTDLDTVFRGTLLADIGMQMLPERLVNKIGHFRKKEYLAYRKHIQFGLQVIAEIPNLDERIASIIRNHHERHDGLGFPRGLRGEQIPVLARFASLAHCFERLINSNNPARRVSPARAMSRIYKQRLLKFPEQLVGEFSAAIGMYPVGTLVNLSSKEVALVLEQSGSGKMNPKIAILSDARGQKLEKAEIVNLAEKDAAERVRSITGPTDIRSTDLDPGEYTFAFAGKRILGMRL